MKHFRLLQCRQSSLRTPIAATESGSLCMRMGSCLHLWNSKRRFALAANCLDGKTRFLQVGVAKPILIPPALCARSWTFSCDPCGGFGIARTTATTFNVFFWLQVTDFDVSLLHSAPNGADHSHIVIFVLCLHDPNYFVATFALGCPPNPNKRKHL